MILIQISIDGSLSAAETMTSKFVLDLVDAGFFVRDAGLASECVDLVRGGAPPRRRDRVAEDLIASEIGPEVSRSSPQPVIDAPGADPSLDTVYQAIPR